MESLYYECHVTISPVFDEKLAKFKEICAARGFKVAQLIMRKAAEDKDGVNHQDDSFCTSRSGNAFELFDRMVGLIHDLTVAGFDVWRYKIEDTLLDSKLKDHLNLCKARPA